MNIKDANIIITGAASGFGREISISLGSEGANIFAIDIDEDSLQSLKETNKNISQYLTNLLQLLFYKKRFSNEK